jgi:hypothetical protein
LRYVAEGVLEDVEAPVVHLTTLDLSSKGHKGLAVQAFMNLVEGQAVTLILRNPPGSTNNFNRVLIPVAKPQPALSPEIPQQSIINQKAADASVASGQTTTLVPTGRLPDDPFLTKVCFHMAIPCLDSECLYLQELMHSLLHVSLLPKLVSVVRGGLTVV